MKLKLYNSLTRKKVEFHPLDPDNVRMYVCGPTVYDRPHLGNARAVVVYDVLYRLLKHLYPKVTYIRNITDVDDKINAAAKENGEPISELTTRVTQGFHDDMQALHNLPPTREPKATEEMDAMIAMIERLVANGHAYESQGHVLFNVSSVGNVDDYYYGKLSGKKLEDLMAGARVGVEDYKKNPEDFVLWKPADKEDDPSSVFDSPWGAGRPGWHIECSAMSTKYLGEDFDIHGGGADLKFPHHENEIAQSCCSNAGSKFANLWVHNGFLTVNGEKMAKSEGNFITVHDLLKDGIPGEVIRFALLSAKYNEPLDWAGSTIVQSVHAINRFYMALEDIEFGDQEELDKEMVNNFLDGLNDDLNTPKAFTVLHDLTSKIHKTADNKAKLAATLRYCGNIVGLLEEDPEAVLHRGVSTEEQTKIEKLIGTRDQARDDKDWAEADRIREELTKMGIILEDGPSGTTWRKG